VLGCSTGNVKSQASRGLAKCGATRRWPDTRAWDRRVTRGRIDGGGAVSGEDEDMMRRALADEARGFQPSDWTGGAKAVHGRVARRRRRMRNALVMVLAASATAATAVVGVALASTSSSTRAGHPASPMAGTTASSTATRPTADDSAPPQRSPRRRRGPPCASCRPVATWTSGTRSG
jgi:hypothetical protein